MLGPTGVVGRRLAMVPAIDVIHNLLSAFQIQLFLCNFLLHGANNTTRVLHMKKFLSM